MDTPLHIGKGASLEPVGTDLPVIKTQDDKPYIPGSSVKGAIRSEFEKILRTLSLKLNEVWACNIFEEEEKCIPKSIRSKGRSTRKSLEELEKEAEAEAKGNSALKSELLAGKILANLCTACSLFGSTEFGSRVHFKDMFLLDGVPIRVEIRDGIAIDRDTGTVKDKFKFDYEIVPKSAKFGFEAVLENVEDWELGLIAMILKSWENGNLTLGGKKSAGLGWGTLKIKSVEEVDEKNLFDFLVEGKTRKVDLDRFISALKNKIKGGS